MQSAGCSGCVTTGLPDSTEHLTALLCTDGSALTVQPWLAGSTLSRTLVSRHGGTEPRHGGSALTLSDNIRGHRWIFSVTSMAVIAVITSFFAAVHL